MVRILLNRAHILKNPPQFSGSVLPSASPQSYAEYSSSDDEIDPAELLRLQSRLNVSSNRNQVDFNYSSPAEKSQESSHSLPSSGFLPLSHEAAIAIPPLPSAPIAALAPEVQDALTTSVANTVELIRRFQISPNPQSAEELNSVRIEAETKAAKESLQRAKQQLMQITMKTAGTALFASVAIPAVMITGGAASAAAPLLGLAKVGIFGQLLNSAYDFFNTASDLYHNKQTIRAVKEMATGFFSRMGQFFKRGQNMLSGFWSSKSSPKFQGGGLQKKLEYTLEYTKEKQITEQMLASQYSTAAETFANQLTQVESIHSPKQRELEKRDAVLSLQRSILDSTSTLLISNGNQEQKQTGLKIQQFYQRNSFFIDALKVEHKKYSDLPLQMQNHLRQLIYDTLTSNIPELEKWGTIQAKAIGMQSQAIQALIVKSKK